VVQCISVLWRKCSGPGSERKQTEKFPQYVGASFGVLRVRNGAIIDLDAIVRTTTTWHRRLTINSRPFGTLLEGYVLLLDYSDPLFFVMACHVNGKVCDPPFSGTCFLFAISLYSLEIPNAAWTKRRSYLKNFRNLNVTVFRFSRVRASSVFLMLLIQLRSCANYNSHFDASSPLKVLITPILVPQRLHHS